MRPRIPFVLLVLCLIPAGVAAQATGVGFPEITVTCEGGDLYVTPGGTGPTLASRGATITVEILDANLEPIVGYPFQDVWVDDLSFEGFAPCPGGVMADRNTDAQGITTISGRLSAGGWVEQGLYVFVAGVQAPGPDLPIAVNSPDIDGDRTVDIADVALFAFDYANGYAFRSDFTHDGQLSLADVGQMIAALGDACP